MPSSDHRDCAQQCISIGHGDIRHRHTVPRGKYRHNLHYEWVIRCSMLLHFLSAFFCPFSSSSYPFFFFFVWLMTMRQTKIIYVRAHKLIYLTRRLPTSSLLHRLLDCVCVCVRRFDHFVRSKSIYSYFVQTGMTRILIKDMGKSFLIIILRKRESILERGPVELE